MPRSSRPNASDNSLDRAGSDETAEEKAAFHLRMRSRGVRDLAVLRAFELVPRRDFVPHRYRDLAARGLALPIGCGQTLDEPWLIARMIEALDVQAHHRILQVGAGTGYATTILAQLAAEVIAIDRFQSLVAAADARLRTIGVANAAVVCGDGLALPPDAGPFDRILVHALLPDVPSGLIAALGVDGVLVAVRPAAEGHVVRRLVRTPRETTEATVCAATTQAALVPGTAAAL